MHLPAPLPSLLLLPLLLLSSSPSPSAAGKCNADDKRALRAIESALGNGEPFSIWPDTPACCDWYGIYCDYTIAGGSRVTSLQIFSRPYLAGSISPAVGDLPFLSSLILRKLPGLVGSIPPSVARLPRLAILILSWNSLSGPIPAFLAQIPSLATLDLSFNNFTGSIPPDLSLLQHLYALALDRNHLTGPIPASFGHFNRSSPPRLYLSHNNLSGEIPPELGGIPWDIIDLSRNKLSGNPSFLLGQSKPTTQIDLSRNLFEFDLSHVSFPANLLQLDLNHNQITGSIPAQLNQLAHLYQFNVSYNRLCGRIPAGSVTAQFGPDAYFHNKCLCGSPLPAC